MRLTGSASGLKKLKEDDVTCQDDLWNMGIAKKHLGQYEEALPMLLQAIISSRFVQQSVNVLGFSPQLFGMSKQALEGWKTEEPDDDVTIAKLHDTVGSCRSPRLLRFDANTGRLANPGAHKTP